MGHQNNPYEIDGPTKFDLVVIIAIAIIFAIGIALAVSSKASAGSGVPLDLCGMVYVETVDYPDMTNPVSFDATKFNGYVCQVAIVDARGAHSYIPNDDGQWPWLIEWTETGAIVKRADHVDLASVYPVRAIKFYVSELPPQPPPLLGYQIFLPLIQH